LQQSSQPQHQAASHSHSQPGSKSKPKDIQVGHCRECNVGWACGMCDVHSSGWTQCNAMCEPPDS
jgi:hypothetical protein